LDRDGLYTPRRGISLGIVPKLVLEANISGAMAVYEGPGSP